MIEENPKPTRSELNIGLGFSTEGGRFQRERRERMLKIVLFAGSRIMRTRGKISDNHVCYGVRSYRV